MRPTAWSCLGETIVALLVLVGLQLAFFPDLPAFLSVNPHPFLAVVVLVSLRYGRLESLTATLMTCAALWAAAMYGPAGETPGLAEEVWSRLVVLLAANLVLGELGALFNREVAEARADLARLREEHEALKARYGALAQVKEELSERIVGQTSSIVSLYEAAKSLASLELAEVQDSLLKLAVKFLGAERCSLWWVDDDDATVLRLARWHGWTDDEVALLREQPVAVGQGPLGTAAKEGRMLTLTEILDHKELSRSVDSAPVPTIMAAPLRVGGGVVGVLNVERIPFLKFTPTAVRLCYLIADLGSSAIAKSTRFSAMQERAVVDPETGLHTASYFDGRFREEVQRFRRTRVPFVYAIMRIDGFAALEGVLKGQVARLLRETAGLLFLVKRELDAVALDGVPGDFRLLLPVTEGEGLAVFARKVQRSVLGRITVTSGAETLRPTASFGAVVAGEGFDTVEGLVAGARGALARAAEEGPGRVWIERGGSGR